ncbi:MAG: PAS domain S-box protein [Thermoplasmata archaeon]|nr:MAG: PAS domain S-box protein [Thermoplasmata archaeon]
MEFISSIRTLLQEIEERGHYLEERSSILQTILDNIPVAIIGTNRYGKINIFNKEAEVLTGYEASDVFSKPLSFLYGKRDYNKIKEGLATDNRVEIETFLINKEGNKIPIHAIISKVDERDIGIIGFYTKSKKEREEIYQSLLKNALFGIYIIQEGKIVYVNPIAEKLLGYEERELIGKSINEIVHPDDVSIVKKGYITLKKAPPKYEVKLLTKNGEVRHIELMVTPITYEGKPAVLGNAIDITERKRAEEALWQSEEKYRGVIENSVEGIYRATVEGEFLEVNNAFLDIFGYESFEEFKEVVPNALNIYVNSNDRKKFLNELVKKGMVKNYEISYKKKDGGIVIVNESAWLIEKNGKKIVEGIIHDITQRKKAEEEAEFYNSLLRHDLGNKSQIILGYLELLQKYDFGGKEKELLQKALEAVRASNELISKVRFLHQIEEDEKVRSIDVDKVIKKVVQAYKGEAEKKGMEIKYSKAGIKARAGILFEEMVANIVENAINHSKGSILEISAKDEGEFCCISIEDDGKGIPDSMKRNIFNKKFKGKGSKGSGLGLYIVKKLAEKYGGKIEVKDGRKKGTRFDIYLPKNL